jgi:hypothetical protein
MGRARIQTVLWVWAWSIGLLACGSSAPAGEDEVDCEASALAQTLAAVECTLREEPIPPDAKPCDFGGGLSLPAGTGANCADGCGLCHCEYSAGQSHALISSNELLCPISPEARAERANKRACKLRGHWHLDGDTWDCGSCMRCTCQDGTLQRATGCGGAGPSSP